MFNSYDDCIGHTVTRSEALRELRKHGACIEDFDFEVGETSTYDAETVLSWLGY